MNSDELTAGTIITIAVIVCFSLVGGCALVQHTNQIAIRQGLVEVPIPGHEGTMWTTPKDK